ncbi:phosphate acyltransferase PlsX [uncultured Clostridium sp.]|uniref:phosphate acyltransferase PlsX n=1 Tax=uncultured Clostridium sp. TaxID=59620 RepID=UPI002634C620|nr:phosphate acyltransferase PlsX [uncultured Clostridium sp.]
MRIVIDGMGGDNAPGAVVEGVIEAIKEYNDVEVYITGPEESIKEELNKRNCTDERIKIVNATEVISTNEHPVMAVRRKKDSSIVKALNLVKSGECDGIISAGSTGAFLAGCTLIVGRIKGVERPALAPIMPGRNGNFMVIDSGANVDCKPEYLVQFANMGSIYYGSVFNKENPTVGLVNIGEEEEKGDDLTKATYKLLKEEKGINFIGNVEPREIPKGEVDVLVCDGFVGNTVLKLYEGAALNLLGIIKDQIMSASFMPKVGAMLLKPVFNSLKVKFDYKEVGGAPFVGVNGICIKAHGSSDGKAFKNAIKQTRIFYASDVVGKIKKEISENN